MSVFFMLEIFVTLALATSLGFAIRDRYVLQPEREITGEARPELYNQIYEAIPLLMIGFSMMFFTLELVLTVFTILTITIVISSKIYLGEKYQDSKSVVLEQAQSYFWVLTIIWIIRSFLLQPYLVPTGSLEPTINPGDFIAVTQYSYGVRVPVIGDTVIDIAKPQRGEIALFRWPENKDLLFIKRVIGVPGDHVVYRNKTLYINGREAKQDLLANDYKLENSGNMIKITKKQEDLLGYKHVMQEYTNIASSDNIDIIIPDGNYFMMGDNRDNSNDSRSWGLVPDRNLVGKARLIWMSVNPDTYGIRWDRIGKKIV
jgi:signal peptidase I